MTDLVFEFTSTAPEMEKAASAALKRLQESALKTATILSGAGKSSAKDLRKMVDEMEGAAGGSVEALSNMASRMEQRANSFRKDATNLRRVAQDHAKLLRDAAKHLQEASDKLWSVELPMKGASAASVKAFTSQFTAAAAQFEDAVGRAGVATAAYIKVDQDFENRLKKKKPKVDLGQDGMKEALKEVDKNADNLNFRISQLAKWQAEYDALYRKTYEKLGEGVSYKSIKADDLLPIDTLAEYKARGVRLGAIDKELWAERQGLAKLATASVMQQATEQLAKQKEADQERLAHQRNMGAYYTRESRLARAEELRAIRQNNDLTLSMVSQGIGQEYSARVKSYSEMFDALSAAESAKLAKQKEADQERLALQRQSTAERMAAAKADRLAELQTLELQNQAVLRMVADGIGEDHKKNQRVINGPSAGEIATSTRQARDRADELARSLRGVTLEANTLHSASRGLASGFNMLWLTWGEMLPLLAGAAISFGTAFSVKMGAQVDHTLQTIRVLSGETQEAIAGLNDQLLQLASTGPVGPLEVAEAMKTLSLAGMSAGDVSVAIRDVMNFAVAGTTDLKQAADVMTSVATAFNVTATGFNYVGDVIAKTAAVSKASVESVGEAFKTASVIHKQFGVSLEDAGIGIAALANLGIQGTAAGTALRNMYTDLSGRTQKVTKAMNELGLELRDQSGKFKDLVTLTMEFDKGLSRLDGTAQKNALLTILSERGGKPMIELRELVIEEEKVAREFAKRSGQAVVEGFEEGVKNRLQRMRDSIGDNAGFQIMARIELSETPLKQMETAVSALQSSLVSAFSSVKSEASGVALALQDLFRSDSFRSNIESLLQLTLNLAGGLVSLAKFANENAGALATLTAAYVGLRLAVGHSLELMTFYTKAQTLATTRSWAATAAVTAERVAQGPLAVQKAIATSATQADTLATWANTGAKYAAITASKLFAATLPYVGVVLAVATGAWMLYESVVGSSTKKMEDAAESSAHGKMIDKLNEETARLNENTDAMLANMTVEQLRLSRGQGLDGSKLGKHKELISAEENLAKATARRIRAQETADGTDDRVAVTMLLEGQAKDKLAVEQENARLISRSVRDATTRTVNAANQNAEVAKKLQAARQSAAKTGTDKLLAEQQRQLAGTAAQNKLDNDLRYNRLDEIAKANKTELDGLRSRLNSEAEALKDFRDANMVQEGEYQSRITSITIEGEKAQKAAAISGWLSYAAEIDRLLTGLSAMPKSQISDNDKANRVQELNAKLLTKAEEFQSDMAKIDEEANKRERRLATDQYKELDKLRKANETAIANSKDRVQAIRDEQEMADKTLGLGGADLEATQARLKIELEAKKELRKFDLESIDKIQARDRLRADAELATDDKTWEAKHRRADDFDAQLRILAKGRADFEVQTQTEVAETVAAVYRKEFKRRTDEIGDELTESLVDALMAGGKEGGQRLRKLLEKELISEPFTIAVRAMVQPFAQAMAGFTAPGAPGANGAPSALNSWLWSGQVSGTSILQAGDWLATSSNDTLAGLGTYLQDSSAQISSLATSTTELLGYANALNTAFSKNAQGGRDYGKAAGQAIGTAFGPIGSMVGGAIGSALGLVDYSGTTHTGGLGSYSRAGGAAYGDTVKSQGLKFGLASKDYRADAAQASMAISATIASTLDATAEAFGNKAGYYVATGFADDISPDGAWGAFMVKLADQTLINWKDNDKWPGRTFADGEAGAKKYAATIGKDMRDYLVTQTPDWADSMLMALGKAPSIDGVVETAGKISQAAKMLETMGRDKMTDTGAAAFEQLQEQFSWWSAEQRAQIAILNAQGKSQEALNRQRELDIALLGEDEKASRRRVFALEDQVALATEAAPLQDRLNEATMTRTELLALERAQILPGNQALFDAVQLAEEQKDLQDRLNEATMTRTELLALERAQILPANRALFDYVTSMEAVAEAKDLMTSSLSDLASELQSTVDDFAGVMETLAKFRTELSLDKSQLSPQEAYKAARAELDKNQALVRSGDKAAMEGFPELASKFLDASAGYFASSSGYFTDLDVVKGMLTATETAARSAQESATAQLTDAQKQLIAIGKIEAEVQSLNAAMAAYTTSIASAITVDLIGQMKYIDTNGDSSVSLKEMTTRFSSLASESTLKKVFTTLDVDGDGQISLLESIKGNTAGLSPLLYNNSSLLTRMQADYDAWFRTSSMGQSTQIPGSNVTVTNIGNGQSKVTGPSGTSTISSGASVADLAKTNQDLNSAWVNQYLKQPAAQAQKAAQEFLTTSPGTTVPWAGGTVSNTGSGAAVWTRTDGTKVSFRADSAYEMAALALKYPEVAAQWRSEGLAFASGGFHSGGMRLVGENGPELEVTGASRIYSAQQTRDLLSNYGGQSNNSELVAELRALRAEVAELKQHAAANVRVAQAVGKAQIETLEVIADASTDSAKSQRLMELAR